MNKTILPTFSFSVNKELIKANESIIELAKTNRIPDWLPKTIHFTYLDKIITLNCNINITCYE